MSYEQNERYRGNLKGYCRVKEANLKKLHSA